MMRVGLSSCLGVILVVIAACALHLGTVATPPGKVLAALFGADDAAMRTIVWEIRAPRILAGALVGFALGASGAALQGLLRNPLADPGVLGVSAAAALAATSVLFFAPAGLAFGWVGLAAILGALVATALLALVAARVRSVVSLLLIGVGLSSVCGALMAVFLNFAPNPYTLADLVNWSLGSVANRSLPDIAVAVPFLAAGVALMIAHARGLSLLSLGEEAAFGAGLDLRRTRLAIVVGAGLAVGAAVGLAGAIGFVGLVAGHVVRTFVGHDPGRALVPAGLLGALLIVGADVIARLLPTASELKLGVIVAILGAPAFIWIAAQRGARDG